MKNEICSVRQLVDASAEITYARGYDPYGVVTYTAGASQTEFGFTGKQYGDSTQLLYLRARHYSPADGRFLSRDTWSGDVNRPLSLNRWMYVEGNPVNRVDPTGKSPWLLNSGEEITADDLKSVYFGSPNEALRLLQKHFSIQPPIGITFRFIRYGEAGFQFDGKTAEGYNPWFYFEKRKHKKFWEYYVENEACQILSTELPDTVIRFDNSIFIFDRAFTSANFHPDDVASVMLHESVHAWQEFIAANEVGAKKASNSFYFNRISNGLERQAYNYEKSMNGVRTKLSPRRLAIIQARLSEYQMGDPSPFTLPAGVP